MPRVFIDGLEAGDVKLWNTATAVIIAAQSGMDGVYCLDCRGDKYVLRTIPALAEVYIAFLYRPTGSTGGSYGDTDSLTLYSGTNRMLTLEREGSNTLYGGIGTYKTFLARTTATFVANTTYFVEVRYKPHNTAGIFQLKVNGALEIDFSGDTTESDTTIDKVKIGYNNYNPYTHCEAYFDNIVIDDAAWPGVTKIQAIVPTGAGNSTMWDPSAGSNYACVDEVPPSETDFVKTNTVGHLDQYAAGNLAGDIESIKCVQVQALTKYEGSPTPTNLQLSVRTGGSNFVSGDKPVLSVSAQLFNLWEENPDTMAPWEVSEVNAMEFGVKAVA